MLMVEETIKKARESLKLSELKRRLPKKVMIIIFKFIVMMLLYVLLVAFNYHQLKTLIYFKSMKK